MGVGQADDPGRWWHGRLLQVAGSAVALPTTAVARGESIRRRVSRVGVVSETVRVCFVFALISVVHKRGLTTGGKVEWVQTPPPRPCLDCKFLQSRHCSTFRLYLTNFVRSWTN